MKACLSAITFITLVAIASAPAQPWGAGKPLISVSGSAEVKVVPDEIYLNVGVETRNKDLLEAKKQNDEHVASALNFLKGNGVKEKDVKTDYINIEPVYLRGDSVFVDPQTGLPSASRSGDLPDDTKPVFYIVRKTIGIKLTDPGAFDAVLGGLVTNGVNNVQGVEFRTSELRKYRDQARAMAVKAAREKAQAMADELGVKLGKADSVSENEGGGWSNWSRNGWGSGGGGGGGFGGFQNATMNGVSGDGTDGGTISVGQISVSASVSVSFLIE